MQKLFLVHLGYYDSQSNGVYESHTNAFIAAKDFYEAKTKAKQIPNFRSSKMHIDGMQQIDSVMGYKVILEKQDNAETVIINKTYKQLSALTGKKNTE